MNHSALENTQELFADRIIRFNHELNFEGRLPKGISAMNPFRENPEVLRISDQFYRKFYSDSRKRILILGINPGRLGAGATGIPFTDSKRLTEECGIAIDSVKTHEPSSVFVYDLIRRYGGVNDFYADYYINSICPLGFVEKNKKGNLINRNYYDYDELFKAVKPFILSSLQQQIDLGVDTHHCVVLGKKNAEFLHLIQQEKRFFDEITVFDHPRFIEQYKQKEKAAYLEKYASILRSLSD